MIGGMILLPFGGKMRRSAGRAGRFAGLLLLILAATGAVLGLAGCGGTSGYFGQQQRNYTVTVTATSGALSHTTPVNFNVE
jgi:ABC-type transporter Mla subunit MlaD